MSRTLWKRKIEDGVVVINDSRIRAAYRLKSADQISYFRPQEDEPEVNKDIRVIWEGGGIVAVYKPSNLPMHEGGKYYKNTFAEVLKTVLGPEWAAVHRLDRETSGIVLCAGTAQLRNQLSVEFRERVMQKTYIAIARGVPVNQTWVVDEPIGDLTSSKMRQKKWVLPDGQHAVTSFCLVSQTRSHSLLKVFPKTGRTHQIRVHSAWCGLPLVGDKKYHPNEDICLEYVEEGLTENVLRETQCHRLCLHAAAITFSHPVANTPVTVESELPADMASAWTLLSAGKHPALGTELS